MRWASAAAAKGGRGRGRGRGLGSRDEVLAYRTGGREIPAGPDTKMRNLIENPN